MPRTLRQIALALLALLASAPASADEAWLITYGPGADAWSRFGHNAIMIRDPESGTATNYAFGYFDMNRPGFLTDFLAGILIYEGHATDAEREMRHYRRLDRSVRRQRLNLEPAEVADLERRLREQVRPENRAYAYDYYTRNCSTRLRDLLDATLGGGLREVARQRPARLNLRQHTHRLSQNDFWLHTGLMLVLGPGIDGGISAWEEMFLPTAMADQLAAIEIDGEPLVVEDRYWYRSAEHTAPDRPEHRFASYAVAGGLTAAFLLLPALFGGGRMRWLPLQLFVGVNGLAGIGLLLLWVASQHDDIWANAVLLLLNPLWLVLLAGRRPPLARPLLAALAGLALAGTVVLAWPEGYQFRPAQLLWLVPADICALVVAHRRWLGDAGREAPLAR